jgi:hypothetical protein
MSARVVAVYVNAINFVGWWTFAHIQKEVHKIIFPSLADRNTSSSVVIPFFSRRIETTALHVTPRRISAGSAHSVPCFERDAQCPTETSATQCSPHPQIVRGKQVLFSAIALTCPERMLVRPSYVSQNDPAPETLVSQIYKTRMSGKLLKNAIFGVVHSVFSNQKMVWARAGERFNLFRQPVSIVTV